MNYRLTLEGYYLHDVCRAGIKSRLGTESLYADLMAALQFIIIQF